MKTSSLVTAIAALLFTAQAQAMSWIPQPMYGSPVVYPPNAIQSYPAQSSAYYPVVGGDRDAYGCIPSAGYRWCESKQRCIRPWEETCSSAHTYGPTASDVCDRTSGYLWCAAKQRCIQPWAEDCAFPSTSRYYPTKDNTIRDEHGCIAALGYYWCEAQSACLRTGTTCTSKFPAHGIQPWDSFGCNVLQGEVWCDSKQSCIRPSSDSCPNAIPMRTIRYGYPDSSSTTSLPPADRDENGCRRDYGYKWCAGLDKCYRPWEERCPEPSSDPYPERCTDTARTRTCIGSPGFRWCESQRACVRIGTKCK